MPSKSKIVDLGVSFTDRKFLNIFTGRIRATIVYQTEDGYVGDVQVQGNPMYPFESASTQQAAIVGTVFNFLESRFKEKTSQIENEIFNLILKNPQIILQLNMTVHPLELMQQQT